MNILTTDQLRKAAPSIFASEAWEGTSDRYTFIPTIDVVQALIDAGFVPVYASQSRTRIPGKSEFTKHMLRFQRQEDMAKIDRKTRPNPPHSTTPRPARRGFLLEIVMNKTELECKLLMVEHDVRHHGNNEGAFSLRAQCSWDAVWRNKNLRAAQHSKLGKINAQIKAAHLRAEIAAL